jgi:hypothetical protein
MYISVTDCDGATCSPELAASGRARPATGDLHQACRTSDFAGSISLALQIVAPNEQRLVVVSVSPQSTASLAARFQLNPTDTARKLTSFFKKIGRCGTLGEQHSYKTKGALPTPEPHVIHPELSSTNSALSLIPA